MKQYFAKRKTNELVEAAEALWDSPEDLRLIRRELLRRKTRGADSLRMKVEARLVDLGGGEPRIRKLDESQDGAALDEATLKRQISTLRIEVMQLRRMAGLNGQNAYLYALVGAHEAIEDYALEALREAHRNKFLREAKARDAKIDDSTEMSEIIFGVYEGFFEEIDRLRSKSRSSPASSNALTEGAENIKQTLWRLIEAC